MKTLLLILALLSASATRSQVYMRAKYRVIDRDFAILMRLTDNDDPLHLYNFGDTLTTKGGRYVCPAVNGIYFNLPGDTTEYKLPADSFRSAPVHVYSTN